LFERLTQAIEDLGAQREPYRSHSLDEALLSIRAELSRILNTRVPGGGVYPSFTPSVTHYGLPNFAHVSASSALERDALARSFARIIEAFEPRLRQVRVTFEPVAGNPRVLTGRLEALLQLNLLSEPVCFSLDVHTGDGTALVDGAAREFLS
jgi:type VI secretion system protein ImpF